MKKKKVSIVSAFDYAVHLLQGNYWQVVWPILILGCIESIQVVTGDYFFLIPLVVNFLRVVLLYSIIKHMLNLAESKNCNWSVLILDREKYLNLFYYSILVYTLFEAGIFVNDLLNIMLVDKIFLILFIYLWIRFYFAAFFIVDYGVNLLESLKLSYKITDGFLAKMLIFFVVFVLVNLTGIIIVIIGRWLVTYPIILGASIYIYQKLIDNSDITDNYKSEKVY
ncbi:MAG: hypothetical protein ACQEP9_01990 [Bacillota bacterium]